MEGNKQLKEKILKIGGVSCDRLADNCGTPLYVYDQEKLEKNLDEYRTYFKSNLFDTEIIYASKAFACKEMYKLVRDHGCSVDVVSGGELYLASQSNMPMDRIYFHGNNKTEDEIQMALDYGCKTIVLDNLMETEKLVSLSSQCKQKMHVIIRINPGISAHTHKYILTGDIDSKFGVSIDDEALLLKIINLVQDSEYVEFDGLHCHIGSQIFDMGAYETLIGRITKFIKVLKDEHKIGVKYLNLGGGFGVRYTEEDAPKSIKEYCSVIINKLESELSKRDLKLEKVMIEPGRSIVAEAGYTIYKVGYMKNTPNKSFAFIDGGMTDNIRVALYEAKYECDLANKMDQPKTKKYTIAGKCCESGDILIEDAMLPEIEPGDLLVVYTTGAYGYSMSSNYNRIRKLAVVFAKDGKARIVIKGETYSDQMRFETDEEVFI